MISLLYGNLSVGMKLRRRISVAQRYHPSALDRSGGLSFQCPREAKDINESMQVTITTFALHEDRPEDELILNQLDLSPTYHYEFNENFEKDSNLIPTRA